MQMFLETLLRCSVAMSVISLVYMMAMSLLSKRYSAKWLYYIWIVIVMGWLVLFRPSFDMNLIPFQIPNIQVIQGKYIDIVAPIKIITNGMNRDSFISLWWGIAIIWISGTAGIIAYNIWIHGCFLKMVARWSEDITDQGTLNLLDNLRTKMKIKTYVGLKNCPAISSPMIIGFFRPIILLPSIEIATDELALILSHELIHLKRNDLWYKALVLLVTAVHWFNPIAYIMAKVIAVQCEISCDELLVKETSLEQRKQYSETLIGIVKNGPQFQTALTTDFYSGGKAFKARIFHIMDTTKKKAGITILCISLILIIGSKITFASGLQRNDDNNISQSELEVMDPTKNKQVINIDITALKIGELTCFGGPYTLEEGDIVKYELSTEGKVGNLLIGFLHVDNKTSHAKDSLQILTITDSGIQNANNQVKIAQEQVGSYWLLIKNNDEEELSNIKGTIKITKGE